MTHSLIGGTIFEQTRLDQITQQLNSGIMETRDDYESTAAQESLNCQSTKISELELERREVIGEILKLNPSYKAPPDYKPLLKEDRVVIPIKEYPGRNFIGLIFGPAGDTPKRLEKETGARIRVYGIKSDTKKESEITSSDGNESHGDYEELYVLVTAETYEKVDAAISLIELLVTPVLANSVSVSTNDPVSGDNPNAVSRGQETPVLVNTGSGLGQPLARFQPYPSQWVQTGQSSGFIGPPFPNLSVPTRVSPTPSNSGPMPSSFSPRPMMSGPLGPVQMSGTGYAGSPRNPTFPPLQISPGQPKFSALPFTSPVPNPNVRPVGSPIPRPGPPLASGWSQPPAGTLGPSRPQMMQPMVRPQASQPITPPPPPAGFQNGPPNSGPHSWFSSPNTPTSIPPPSIRSPLRPQQPSSNDFTFQTNRPQSATSQQVARYGSQPGSEYIPPRNPQSPSFRPGINSNIAPPVFHRPQNSHQMGQHQGPDRQPIFPGHGPQPSLNNVGPRQFGPGPPGGPFPHRPGNFGPVQQNHPSMGFRPQNLLASLNQQFRGNGPYPLSRPGSNPSGPQQVYDPFSPSAVPHKPGNNPQNSRKQDSDPEYDDLMASVGVK